AGGLALGREILGLTAMIHHLGGQEGDLAPNAFICHEGRCADFSPSRRRRARWVEERPKSKSRARLIPGIPIGCASTSERYPEQPGWSRGRGTFPRTVGSRTALRRSIKDFPFASSSRISTCDGGRWGISSKTMTIREISISY